MIKYENYKNEKANDLKKRDIDFDKFKSDIYNIEQDKEYYERFLSEQELFFKSLEEKISVIDKNECISYRLKGFNKLLGNSFKYLGLLLINPLKGLIPGIATQTVVTKNLVHNLYNNLVWEENKKLVYKPIDYSLKINNAINNLEDISSLIDSTLEEIIDLKNKYISLYEKNENDLQIYKDTIGKINKMEYAILGSKIKIDLMKQKMLENEKVNSNKMKIVKKLNSSNNN